MNDVLLEKDLIHETIASYCFYFDGGEFDKWVDLFTDDGIFDCAQLMTTTGLNDLIDAFSNLPLEDKEYAVDVIKKQLIEAKREFLFKRTKQAEACLKKGMVKRGTVNTLYEDLENDSNSLRSGF